MVKIMSSIVCIVAVLAFGFQVYYTGVKRERKRNSIAYRKRIFARKEIIDLKEGEYWIG